MKRFGEYEPIKRTRNFLRTHFRRDLPNNSETTQESTRPAGLLDFMVHHDGTQPEISSDDQKYVAIQFKSLIQDLHLNYPRNTLSYPATRTYPQEETLSLQSPYEYIRTDHGLVMKHWQIRTRLQSETDMAITLYRYQGELRSTGDIPSTVHDMFTYHLDKEGIVRRTTQLEIKLAHSPVISRVSLDTINTLDTMILNNGLEQFTGRGNQPIGPKEFDGLRDFVTKPGLKGKYVVE